MRVVRLKLISASPSVIFRHGFAAAGPHCQLSISRLQIEIDLPDCEPQAERWTLSDPEEPTMRHVVT